MTPRDRVALVLAVALALAVVGAFVAVTANVVLSTESPAPSLGENTTQVLIAIVGGIIGVLGSYFGSSRRDRD